MTHLVANPGVLGRLRVAGLTLLLWGCGLAALAPAQAFAAKDGKAGAVRDERAATGRAQAGPATKNVLLLFSGRFIAPLSIAVDEAVRATFQRSPSMKVELYGETLDVARFDPERYGTLLAAYLREKFADRKLDLIITSLPQAPRFLLKFRKELFPDTPIVYCLADESELAALTPAPNVTGVPLRIPWKETLDLALGVHPDTRHVVVIAGRDGLARVYLRSAQQLFQPYENRLAFTYLTDRTLPQLLKEVASLPPHTVIIYTTFAMDGTGRVYIDAEVSGMVAKAANAPVYSINNQLFGRGITGGHIIDNGAHAARATEIGLRILAGEKPEAIIVGDVPSPPRFDARQLKRWNIAESRLPAGSIVLYKDPSFWEQYRLLILILGVCLLEALLILALLVHRRRRRVAEARLQENEERLRLATTAAALGIWSWDIPRDRIVLGELARKMLAEPSSSEVTYTAFLSMVDRDDRARVDAALQDAIRTGKDFEIEYRVPQRDGTVAWIASRGSCTHKQAGAPVRMTGVSLVITERKRAEEELRKHREHLEEMVRERTAELVMARDQAEVANRAKSTFLANMSHELRTPLNSVLGVAQLMERDAGFPRQHRDTLRILSRSGTHLLELINDVLEMSKIEAGKMAPVMTSFDLRSFLGDLEEMTRLRAEQKGLQLRFEYKTPVPQYVETDVRKLRQILVNLLGNAVKYTEKGRVTLRIGFRDGMGTTPVANLRPPARLEFEVEDTGIGVAPENQKRIFDPFVQLNLGGASREGTGLGLTLSRMFIELLGGEIAIRSQAGKGSTFAFDIAVKLAQGAAAHTQEADRRVIGLLLGQPRYRLLIVDDSAENRLVLRQLLEGVGFHVLEAAGGQEAVDLHKSGQPHLIWMDLRMPGMDGNEAARRIREAESGGHDEAGKEIHTPIIALTAGVMGDEGVPSRSPVFDDWVYKPFREGEVFAKLEQHLAVQFVYQPSVLSTIEQDKTREKAALTPADLSVLPAGWLKEFFETMEKGRSRQLLNMIEQIPPEHADLARVLAELVRIHQFEELIALTQEALKEEANG